MHRLSLQLSGLFHSDLHAHVVYSPPLLTSPRSRVKVKAGLLETSLYPPIPLAPVYLQVRMGGGGGRGGGVWIPFWPTVFVSNIGVKAGAPLPHFLCV